MQSSSAVQVRLAQRHEAEEIGALVASTFELFRGVLPPHILAPYIEDASDIAGRWDAASVAVVEAGGRIAGTVTYYADAGREGMGWPATFAGLRTLAVAPSAQGSGLGRALCRWCVANARHRKADALALHTAGFMVSACALYESMGFQRSPSQDLLASAVLGFDPALGDQDILAYLLPLRN